MRDPKAQQSYHKHVFLHGFIFESIQTKLAKQDATVDFSRLFPGKPRHILDLKKKELAQRHAIIIYAKKLYDAGILKMHFRINSRILYESQKVADDYCVESALYKDEFNYISAILNGQYVV